MEGKKLWIPLESNPDSMYSYACKLGQSKLKFLDVYGFHKELLDMITQPVCALIFLYPINDKLNVNNSINENLKKDLSNIWFMKQTVHNSCGTIALLHLFGNLKNKFPLNKGSVLDNFFNKVKDLSPEEKGKEFENDKNFELLHHEFSGKGEDLTTGEINVDTHFVVFLEIDGHVVELDGRKNQHIIHSTTTPQNFKYDVGNIIQKKFIEGSSDNRFSAIAVVPASDV